MDLISKLFNLDFSGLVPELPKFLMLIRTLLAFAMLAGPVALMIIGALCLYKPQPEANLRKGYRTYYGMGSTEAWQFSQKIGGLAYGALGAGLTLIMLIVILCFIGKTLLTVSIMAMICLIVQLLLIAAAKITVYYLCKKYFDKDGNRRQVIPKKPAPRYKK